MNLQHAFNTAPANRPRESKKDGTDVAGDPATLHSFYAEADESGVKKKPSLPPNMSPAEAAAGLAKLMSEKPTLVGYKGLDTWTELTPAEKEQHAIEIQRANRVLTDALQALQKLQSETSASGLDRAQALRSAFEDIELAQTHLREVTRQYRESLLPPEVLAARKQDEAAVEEAIVLSEERKKGNIEETAEDAEAAARLREQIAQKLTPAETAQMNPGISLSPDQRTRLQAAKEERAAQRAKSSIET